MKILTLSFISLLFLSCRKSANSVSTQLQRTEYTSYTGDVLYNEYGYDGMGRITSITQHVNTDQPVVAVTIEYNGNEASLISHPDNEPTLDQTREVILTLDIDGKLLKRIGYTHGISKEASPQPSELFSYDTLLCEYDAAGLLKKKTYSRYDSSWINPTLTLSTRLNSVVNFISADGNLVSSDEYVTYPRTTRDNGIVTVTGGSSEYHNVFDYSKSFPNRMDFKNAAVLNEFRYDYEPLLNSNYKNMHNQMTTNNIDKDLNGTVVFTSNSTIDAERTYNSDGLLAADHIAPGHTQYVTVNYFYGK
jgi:hypothetical protein